MRTCPSKIIINECWARISYRWPGTAAAAAAATMCRESRTVRHRGIRGRDGIGGGGGLGVGHLSLQHIDF